MSKPNQHTSDLLKKVRKIEIKSRGLSNQIFSGEYHSAFKGRGMAFSEVRNYQMGDEITDEMLDSFAVIGTYDQIAGKIKSTYGKYATSVSFGMDTQNEEEENILRDVIKNLKGS